MGVIVRESLTSSARYAFMGISSDLSFRWQSRGTTGGRTSSTIGTTAVLPNVWTRLVRTNSTFSGYTSPDGTNWTLVGSRSITMATNVYFGLVVASGSSNILSTATFADLIVVP